MKYIVVLIYYTLTMNVINYPEGLNPDIIQELERSNINSVKKRLSRELLDLQNQGAYISVEYNSNCDNINYINSKHLYTINIVLNNTTDLISFQIYRDYPFRPFKNIKINYKLYSSFLKIREEKTLNEVKTMYFNVKKQLIHCCLCCSSIICEERWNPLVRIRNVIEEIQEYKKIRRAVINKLLAFKILNKYVTDDTGFHKYFYSFLYL